MNKTERTNFGQDFFLPKLDQWEIMVLLKFLLVGYFSPEWREQFEKEQGITLRSLEAKLDDCLATRAKALRAHQDAPGSTISLGDIGR